MITENVVTDYYLTFADEATANSVLEGLEGYAVDIIGETEVYPGQYLVNLRGPMNDSFDSYIAVPVIPYRTWA